MVLQGLISGEGNMWLYPQLKAEGRTNSQRAVPGDRRDPTCIICLLLEKLAQLLENYIGLAVKVMCLYPMSLKGSEILNIKVKIG